MRWFINLQTKNKLLLTFMLIASLIVVVGAVGIVSLDRINKNLHLTHSEGIEKIELLNKANQIFLQAEIETNKIIWESQITEDLISREGAKMTLDKYTKEYNQILNELNNSELNDTMKGLMIKYEQSYIKFASIRDSAIQSAQQG